MTQTERIVRTGVVVDPPPQTDVSQIGLAGYELQSQLGSGGYGEVWKAVGPGGFPKAVKILYGHRDGEHAEAELKALNRMRDLRHPFLLNIERVEVCNNRLVVVTELADCNLNDRFEACVAEGKMGIPREELLGYLRDAADALDFMCEEHGLQHLDIKPDNLLLQGNYVKLADFSLAKDVSMANVSMINGFTPLYSSPELFEGRPGRHSDQYSLAIVYQMMLTGQAPFNGRNAAQLTSQHLRSQPELLPLDLADRPVISRALSKTASARYSCCREMVDELLNRNRGSRPETTSVRRTAPNRPSAAAVPETGAARPEPAADFERSKPASVDCDPQVSHGLRPALFIGVGGIGTKVLRQLKNAWSKAAQLEIPAWRLLAIDTDIDSLRVDESLPDTAQLNEKETLAIRLRSSKEYRQSKHLDMSWLSRRWLFNIPRSCQVEGMRPLGRLAVQDHLPEMTTRIKDQLKQAIDAAAVGQSAAAVSVPFASGELDVFVVAATSGGTGSGAAADVALIVQELLDETEGIKASVSGLLLHVGSTSERVDGIQAANTIACLKELRLLGMEDMGIRKGFSRAAMELTPFDHTWLLHCGDQLTDSQFASAADSAAEFLFNVTATPAATPWRQWREQHDPLSGEDGEPSFGLLGTSAVDSDVYSMAESEAVSLAAALMKQRVASIPGDSSTAASATQRVRELLSKLQLTDESLPQRILEELRGNSGRQIENLAENVFQRATESGAGDSLHEFLAAELTNAEADRGAARLADIRTHAGRSLNQERQHAERLLRSLVLEFMENADAGGHVPVTSALQKTLEQTQRCCRQLAQETSQAFQQLSQQSSGGVSSPGEIREICRQYCVLSGSMAIYDVYQEHLRRCCDVVDGITTEVASVQQTMEQVLQRLLSAGTVHDGIPAPVQEAFRAWIANDKTLRVAAFAEKAADVQQLAEHLVEQATGFLLSADVSDGRSTVAFPATAWPALKGLGGRHRMLAWIPEGMDTQTWKSKFGPEFDDAAAVFHHRRRQIRAVCEVEGVSSTRLLKHLQAVKPASWEMAGRIHTRTDVQW